MAMTPEGKVKKQVKALLAERGPELMSHWPVQTGFGSPTLDCVGCFRGLYFAIETKAPGQHLTPRQELTKRDMERAMAQVFVIGEFVDERGNYSGMENLRAWLSGEIRTRAG